MARKVTDRAAGQVIRCALRLTSCLPRAMGLLESGVLTVPRAVALVTELEVTCDQVARLVDTELAQVITLLPVWRIEQEVRRAVLRLDPEAAATRVAAKNTDRAVSFTADLDDQALVSLTGPAVPLTRWYATLDTRARALKAAGCGHQARSRQRDRRRRDPRRRGAGCCPGGLRPSFVVAAVGAG